MKRRLAAGGVVLSLLAILALGTAAYFSTNGRAQNEITMGTVQLNLTETIALDDGTTADATTTTVNGILPGQTIDQTATIENTGNQAYWLRVKTDVQIIGKDGEGLSNTLPTGEKVITFNIDTAEGEPTEIWIEEDGWYYFPAAVAAKETVSPFDKVTFAAAAGNDYQGCTINIRVDAQAVQVKNNDPTKAGGSVLDVKGWPDDTDPGVEPGEPVPGGGGTVTP